MNWMAFMKLVANCYITCVMHACKCAFRCCMQAARVQGANLARLNPHCQLEASVVEPLFARATDEGRRVRMTTRDWVISNQHGMSHTFSSDCGAIGGIRVAAQAVLRQRCVANCFEKYEWPG